MPNNELKITVFGDICPMQDGNPFGFVVPDDEIVVGNLECALTDHPKPVKKAGPVLYNPTSFAATLKENGFYAVSLANNHIRDCGDEGVLSTINACKSNGIKNFGAGETLESAAEPLIIEQNGIKVAFVSFAEKEFNFVQAGKAGAIAFDPYESYDKIRDVRKNVDALIVLYHGGIEHYIYPSPLLRKKCRKMIEAGAHVVLCQHSHCIGTREEYKGGEILYGQGNSVFGYRKSDDSWNHGLLARITVSATGCSVSYDVLEAHEDGRVFAASESATEKIIAELNENSKHIQDNAFIIEKWDEFCSRQKSLYLPMLFGFGANLNRLNRLLNNGIVALFYRKGQKNVTHNIIRCEAHREVIETILKKDDY